MDLTVMIMLAVAAGLVLIAWRSQRGAPDIIGPVRPFHPRQAIAAADANTRAIEENTAAIRDLIAKLDGSGK